MYINHRLSLKNLYDSARDIQETHKIIKSKIPIKLQNKTIHVKLITLDLKVLKEKI
jgi:hypothetical protein